MDIDPNLIIGFAFTLTLSVVGLMAKVQRDIAVLKTDMSWVKQALSTKGVMKQ